MADRPLSVASTTNSLARAANIPLPGDDGWSLREPYAPAGPSIANESPRDSCVEATPYDSGTLLPMSKNESYIEEEDSVTLPQSSPKAKRRPLFLLVGLVALIVVVLAVVLPVYFRVIKPRHVRTSQPSSNGGGGTSHPPTSHSPPSSANAITGGDGSSIKASDGTTFTYNNKLGGIWWSDPNDPYNTNAYPNSWTPPLNQSWNYGTDRIYGVNLGGWFVLEPYISPALFQKYPGATDEWSLSLLMAADTANGGLNQIEDHYKTFITEADIAEIAGAGLNWVRLPIPFWAIDKWGDEPFLARTSWKYIVQLFEWCRKYGIRVNLDLHTIPGSSSGYNFSGKGGGPGQVNFLRGVMGMANAQRALNYIRIITEFISQPEYTDVVPMFSIMNEPVTAVIGATELNGFYVEAYNMIRGIAGIGAGKGPYIALHEGFQGLSAWAGFMTGADRMVLDTHPYFAFDRPSSTAPIDTGTGAGAGGTWPQAACERWASSMNTSRSAFGITIAGEWSNGFNDCGLFLLGVGLSPSYGGSCSDWQDSSNWTAGTKAGLMALASASMDALGDWFFWTWKIGNSAAGIVESPLWSYQLGLRGGWMPTDPRTALGSCGPPSGPIFPQTFQSWMTGGAGAGTIAAAQTAQYPYPPDSLQGTAVAQLPLYTSTGIIATLPAPTPTDLSGRPIGSANGWFNSNDNQLAPTPILGCAYPDPWDAVSATIPTGCTGGVGAALPAAITPPPQRRTL